MGSADRKFGSASIGIKGERQLVVFERERVKPTSSRCFLGNTNGPLQSLLKCRLSIRNNLHKEKSPCSLNGVWLVESLAFNFAKLYKSPATETISALMTLAIEVPNRKFRTAEICG